MIALIAWRNVWRNRTRSIAVIGAVVVGVWGLIFAFGFMNSFIADFVSNAILREYSHIQLHHPDFKKDHEIKYFIPRGGITLESISQINEVKAMSGRVLADGMINSPKTANGVRVFGIDLGQETATTHLDSLIVEGDYFQSISRNPVLIPKSLAKKLKVKLRSKVVLTFQNLEGDIIAGAFRITGLFEKNSANGGINTAFVRKEDLQNLLGLSNNIHEIAILLDKIENEPLVIARIRNQYSNLLTESWRDLAPELELMQGQVKINMSIVMAIMMLALGFGMVNTMLMAVLERFREIGMLKAVGMRKGKIFKMILAETLYMALIGTPIGMFVGIQTINYLNRVGVDLSAYSEGLKDFGYDTIFYPAIDFSMVISIAIGVGVTALLASLYPGIKAIKLNPVEALRKI